MRCIKVVLPEPEGRASAEPRVFEVVELPAMPTQTIATGGCAMLDGSWQLGPIKETWCSSILMDLYH